NHPAAFGQAGNVNRALARERARIPCFGRGRHCRSRRQESADGHGEAYRSRSSNGFRRYAGRRRSLREDAVTAMFNLEGRTALVTGASGGIGSAIARALHGQGAVVVLSGTRVEALHSLKNELGPRSFAIACDLRDPAAVESLARSAEDAAG